MPLRHISVSDLRCPLHLWSYEEYVVRNQGPRELHLLVISAISSFSTRDMRPIIQAYLDRAPPEVRRVFRDEIPAWVVLNARQRWNRVMPSCFYIPSDANLDEVPV